MIEIENDDRDRERSTISKTIHDLENDPRFVFEACLKTASVAVLSHDHSGDVINSQPEGRADSSCLMATSPPSPDVMPMSGQAGRGPQRRGDLPSGGWWSRGLRGPERLPLNSCVRWDASLICRRRKSTSSKRCSTALSWRWRCRTDSLRRCADEPEIAFCRSFASTNSSGPTPIHFCSG